MNTTTKILLTSVAALATGASASADDITTIANGWWDNPSAKRTLPENPSVWDTGTLPGPGDTAIINHEIFVDDQDDPNIPYTGYDTTAADVVINTGGSLKAWFGIFNSGAMTLNGGTIAANQRTHVLRPSSLTINDVPGNVWTQFKNQTSKHAEIITPLLLGDGTLDIQLGRAGTTTGQLFELNVDDTTGFTGELNVSRLGYDLDPPSGFTYRLANPNAESNFAHLKINQSVAKEDASFSMVLNEYTFDWTEANGGTAATDDGTAYNGYDIRDENVEVWLTGLTIGGFEVPGRETAYTSAELIALDANIANYLRSDGTDGLLGVVPSGTTPLAGDYNSDDIVDLADYTIWRNNLGATGLDPGAPGDGNGDGDVTAADYEVWKNQFGATNAGLGAANTTSVPEPTGAMIMCIGLLLAVKKTRQVLLI